MPAERIQPLTLGIYENAIGKFGRLAEGERRAPVVSIPYQGARSDDSQSIRNEVENFSGMRTVEDVSAGLTLSLSPHTVARVSTSAIESAVQTTLGTKPSVLPEEDVAAHLLTWWWGKDGSRCDLLQLSHLPDREREKYIQVIAQQVSDGVEVLRASLGLSKEDAAQAIKIYGLWGHGTAEERRQTGLSRGAQSSPDGHLNIAYHPYENIHAANLQQVTLSETAKQIGAWDSITFYRFESTITEQIRRIVAARTHNNPAVEVAAVQTHSARSDGKALRFFEGHKVTFDRPVDFHTATVILLDTVDQFGTFYDKLSAHYAGYHKNITDSEKKAHIRKQLLEDAHAMKFEGPAGEELADYVLSMQPTYTQVTRWAQELQDEGKSPDDPSVTTLVHLRGKYKAINDRLNRPGGRNFVRAILLGNYDITSFEADILLTMIEDRLKPAEEYRNIEFTMPKYFSGSYFFEDYEISEDRSIQVKSLTFSSRLGSTKGAIEDMLGVVIRRSMGQ